MRPNAFKDAVARIKAVKAELKALQEIVREALQREDLGQDRRDRLDRLLFNSERTYMRRLFIEFEDSLTTVGPRLSVPIAFSASDGLATKLDQVGKAMRMDARFRAKFDDGLRELRNELLHGRSLTPRLSFEAVYDLMREFHRGCH